MIKRICAWILGLPKISWRLYDPRGKKLAEGRVYLSSHWEGDFLVTEPIERPVYRPSVRLSTGWVEFDLHPKILHVHCPRDLDVGDSVDFTLRAVHREITFENSDTETVS